MLEDVLRGTRARVRSQNVSREAVRWDVLLGRVMDGVPPSLWGPTRFFEPRDEPELLAELERLARASGKRPDEADLSVALRSHALELMRFTPLGWNVEPSFFTLEGDPVALASATWQVRHPVAARDRLRALGGLPAGEPLEVDITVAHDALVSRLADQGLNLHRLRRQPRIAVEVAWAQGNSSNASTWFGLTIEKWR